MTGRAWTILPLAVAAVGGMAPCAAWSSEPSAQVPLTATSAEMPALSGIGQYVVGTVFEELDVDHRKIGLRFWFPARPEDGAIPQQYHHRRAIPGAQALDLSETGIAVAPAKALRGRTFPLIVISHGYGGWAEHLSRLGETMASRGYVVVSIDHRDQPFNDMASFATSFAGVLVNRSRDQQAALRTILAGSLRHADIARQVDRDAIGLLGFSMGGYGALVTAGVPLDRSAPAYRLLPADVVARLPQPDPMLYGRIRAVVALAPWGAQPDARVWRDADLAGLKTPLMLIDGDRDDVVDFEKGVKWLFAATKATDRYLLTYREAAHNIAGNPMTLPAGADFSAIEFFYDPVWRKERIEAINAHFVSAFFDLHLKNDEAKRRSLDVPVPVAADGRWPSSFGQQWGGTVAGDDQPDYWRGFQRRWARGLEMHHLAAGK